MSHPNTCSNPDCAYGWVIFKYFDVKSVRLRTGEIKEIKTEYEGAQPCPVCDPSRAELFATAQNQDELQISLMNRSTHKRLEAYNKAEESKTKVL